MPFISKSRLVELEAIELRAEEFDNGQEDIQKAHQRQVRRLNKSHLNDLADLAEMRTDEMRELNKSHRDEVQKLNDRVDAALEKAANAERKAKLAADKQIEDEREDMETTRRDSERELNRREAELDGREEDLNSREERLDARKEAIDNAEAELAKNVKKHAEEISTARIEGEVIGEKRGYANGIADGLRKVQEVTKEATDQTMKMATTAQDALVKAATREIPAPVITTLAVPTAAQTNSKK